MRLTFLGIPRAHFLAQHDECPVKGPAHAACNSTHSISQGAGKVKQRSADCGMWESWSRFDPKLCGLAAMAGTADKKRADQ
jgi:hypothetical protein